MCIELYEIIKAKRERIYQLSFLREQDEKTFVLGAVLHLYQSYILYGVVFCLYSFYSSSNSVEIEMDWSGVIPLKPMKVQLSQRF